MRKRRTTARRRFSLIFFAVLLFCSSVPVYGQEENRQEVPAEISDGTSEGDEAASMEEPSTEFAGSVTEASGAYPFFHLFQ